MKKIIKSAVVLCFVSALFGDVKSMDAAAEPFGRQRRHHRTRPLTQNLRGDAGQEVAAAETNVELAQINLEAARINLDLARAGSNTNRINTAQEDLNTAQENLNNARIDADRRNARAQSEEIDADSCGCCGC